MAYNEYSIVSCPCSKPPPPHTVPCRAYSAVSNWWDSYSPSQLPVCSVSFVKQKLRKVAVFIAVKNAITCKIVRFFSWNGKKCCKPHFAHHCDELNPVAYYSNRRGMSRSLAPSLATLSGNNHALLLFLIDTIASTRKSVAQCTYFLACSRYSNSQD